MRGGSLGDMVLPLLSWYSQNARDLPWRRDPTPYHVWLSEVMLQQTRVAAVLDYYRRFLEALPTVEDLARCPEDKLLKLWEGLGYYSRARNLKRAAQVITEDCGGQFPANVSALRALPGIGDYTAGAIASIAFGLPEPAVDGNVLRVCARVAGDPSDISLPATRRALTQRLREIMPVKAPGQFNQALMELGATVCLPNGAPLCGVCPVRDLCAARREEIVDRLPVKTPKAPRRVEDRRVWLLFYEGRVALRRRPPKGLLAGLWEFPNTLEGEPPPAPVVRPRFAGTARHIFTHLEWHMTAYTADAAGPRLPEGWVWASLADLRADYPLPNAFKGFQELVEARSQQKKVE